MTYRLDEGFDLREGRPVSHVVIDACRDLAKSTANDDIRGLINEAIHSLEGNYFNAAHTSLMAAINVCRDDVDKAKLTELADDCVALFTRSVRSPGLRTMPTWNGVSIGFCD